MTDPKTPAIGDGATIVHYSDRDPATVIRVVSPTCVVVQVDRYERSDKNGMSDCQEYTYSADPEGVQHIVKWHAKIERWIIVASERARPSVKGGRVLMGSRRRYFDYSF